MACFCTHCFEHTLFPLRSTLICLHFVLRDNDPRIASKFVFEDDIVDKTAARKVIYSLFPGVDVYRVWIKSAFKLSASTQQMALLVETRARRVQEGSSGW